MLERGKWIRKTDIRSCHTFHFGLLSTFFCVPWPGLPRFVLFFLLFQDKYVAQIRQKNKRAKTLPFPTHFLVFLSLHICLRVTYNNVSWVLVGVVSFSNFSKNYRCFRGTNEKKANNYVSNVFRLQWETLRVILFTYCPITRSLGSMERLDKWTALKWLHRWQASFTTAWPSCFTRTCSQHHADCGFS